MNDPTAYRRPDGTLPAFLGDEVHFTVTIPQCHSCLWFHDGGTCDAFPAGIPDAIYLNLADHRQRYPGDGGLRFAPLPDVEVGDDE